MRLLSNDGEIHMMMSSNAHKALASERLSAQVALSPEYPREMKVVSPSVFSASSVPPAGSGRAAPSVEVAPDPLRPCDSTIAGKLFASVDKNFPWIPALPGLSPRVWTNKFPEAQRANSYGGTSPSHIRSLGSPGGSR